MRNMPLLQIFTLCIFALLFQPALAAPKPWVNLTPIQQEALAPLAGDWDTIPEKQQRQFIRLAKRYPKLTAVQKQRMLERLNRWSKLTPEQRAQARDKFRAFSKVPPKQREQVKQILQQEADPLAPPAASGIPSGNPAP